MDTPPWRKSLRLPGYDYRQPGAYFVTICLLDRQHLFGRVVDGVVHESPAGQMVRGVWEAMPLHYPGVERDEFMAMPDHIHGIIRLTDHPARLSLPQLVQRFKSLTAARYREGMRTSGWQPHHGALWQRNYYEHVVRDDDELNRIRQYIRDNPLRWMLERDFPENLA